MAVPLSPLPNPNPDSTVGKGQSWLQNSPAQLPAERKHLLGNRFQDPSQENKTQSLTWMSHVPRAVLCPLLTERERERE
jgi:hypothetical protein